MARPKGSSRFGASSAVSVATPKRRGGRAKTVMAIVQIAQPKFEVLVTVAKALGGKCWLIDDEK